MIRFAEEQSGEADVDLLSIVNSIFREGGILEQVLGFEHRPEQYEMARSICASLLKENHLLFEAGTGVGKSLAYLIPSILFSKLNKRPCVVATNTISLQEQLLDKDIPAVRTLMEETSSLKNFLDFRCALLVGRANYLCTTRLHRALSGQGELFEGRQRQELERIAKWATSGSAIEGIRQELSPQPMGTVWDAVSADSSLCSSKRCKPENCFYRKARAEVEESDLVIVNHSLLFSLMGAGFGPPDEKGGVMFANDFVVFDEAHEMPEVAGDHLGLSISSWALEMSIRRIYNSKKRKGLISRVGRTTDFEAVENAELAVSDFFQYLHINTLGKKDRIRLMEKGILPMEIFPPLSRLCRSLIELGELTEDESLKLELKDQARRMQGYLNGLAEVLDLKDSNAVYWIERTGKQNQIIHLRSAPLEIAKALREQLFARDVSVLMTSATLTRKGTAKAFRSTIGVELVDEGIVDSPFDYDANLQIRVLSDCPDPMSSNRLPYLDYMVEVLNACATSIEGGTLVLFTNYSDLKHCYHNLLPRWKKLGRSVYAQGEGLSRSELREKMIEEQDVLLLGAESFWKGFDAKGPCLSQVIITRLPFENPGHPVLEAKSELLSKAGKSSFMEITLPTAVIRFRQGMGRLIRSRNDLGELIILDSRILKKGYGRDFIREFPKKEYEIINSGDLLPNLYVDD
jgi:ATP-dependent DNA helicase DinG